MTRGAPDVLVVGAGIFGLSVAWAASQRGLSVRVLEVEQVGAGASGGIVGALTPHAPSRWRPMMAFQFEALSHLPEHIARLEAETGCTTGYVRSGRVTPLVSQKARAAAERDVLAAPETWGNRARHEILESVPEAAHGWIRPEAAPFGLVRDTISARVDPRAYMSALAAGLGDAISGGVRVTGVSGDGVYAGAEFHPAGTVVLAAGWQVWDLVQPHLPDMAGQPVKGQSALFRADAGDLPVIYQDGLYIVPHAGGRVAVGSTSEKVFGHASDTDELLEDVIARARVICPALQQADVIKRWAGLRPKPPGREPVIGPLPDMPSVWLAAGGYKISFGIAHAVADAVVSGILRETPDLPLPDSFDPARSGGR